MIQKRTSLIAKFEQKFQLLGVPFSKASFYSSLKGFKSVLFPTEETKLDQIFKLLMKQETLKPNSFFSLLFHLYWKFLSAEKNPTTLSKRNIAAGLQLLLNNLILISCFELKLAFFGRGVKFRLG